MSSASLRSWSAVGLGVLLAAVLVTSGVLKAVTILTGGSGESLSMLSGPGVHMTPALTGLIVVIELALAAVLVCSRRREVWLSVTGALFLLMSVFLIWTKPAEPGVYHCGCFGDSFAISPGQHLIFNGGLIVIAGMALLLIRSGRPQAS